MTTRWIAGLGLVVLSTALAAPAAASDGSRTIIRIRSGLDGWSAINSICLQLGCQVVRPLDTLPGQTQPASLFLVLNLPALTPLVNSVLQLGGVESLEPDLLIVLARDDTWSADQASAAVVDQLADRTLVNYYGAVAWAAYLQQPAAGIVRLSDTHCILGEAGGGIVAVIDTGVDPQHPTLQAVLTGGYDFTRNTYGGDETADVQQASAAVVDDVRWVNSGTAAPVDQATADVLSDGNHDDFGHGTMVAGVVHLTAPRAQIMPLKAFAANGQGYTSDIVRAVNYATSLGAKVINMSFSSATASAELRKALTSAMGRNIILVASAGNGGTTTLVYPAAWNAVLGVASTANDDTRSSFSNYGAQLVDLAAPGEGIITTYPWASFAAAWGTSFSAPFVAGTAALLAGMSPSATSSDISSALSHAQPLTSDLGWGRLDSYQAVSAGFVLWPSAPRSQSADACTVPSGS